MPLTVITVKNAPQLLKGDLTKWMQEIATGVYVGNFNTKVREELWRRVKENVGDGEATISYAFRNEIGYSFDTIHAKREVINCEGIPLVLLPLTEKIDIKASDIGYSKAAKFRKTKKFSNKKRKINFKPYAIIDIETDGLDESKSSIIELGAVKLEEGELKEFGCVIEYNKQLSDRITDLTGITTQMLNEEGLPLDVALDELLQFIGDLKIVGYGVEFDIKFINSKLKQYGKPLLKNKRYDLMKYVKSEKLFLDNYKLQTVLKSYGIEEKVPHRALLDSLLIYKLSTKVNKFLRIMERD